MLGVLSAPLTLGCGDEPGGDGSGAGAGGSAIAPGGSAGMPANPVAGGGAAGAAGGGGSPIACTITATASLSAHIGTVGVVTFTTDLASLSAARIEFGLDTNYGMIAPVDLTAQSYRTLLLGMKAARTYNYRIVVQAGNHACAGQNHTITTGPLASGLPAVHVSTANATALAGGFIITGQYAQGGGVAPAYVVDADGDIVWWFSRGRDVTGARMSWDGKYMWTNASNVPESQGANVHRVSMDGASDEDLSRQFAGQNHQLTILPDESVVFYAYGNNGCDDIKERAPNGTVRTIVNAQAAHGGSGACHVNHIEYSPEDDTLIFSDLDHDNYTKLLRTGEVVWVLGGPTSDFTGTGASWQRQHGLDVLGLDRLVFFNNGMQGGGGSSLAIEVLLDMGTMSASRTWTYDASPAIANQVMGDVQRLPNGNTLIAYSTQGVLHEVSSTGQLLREISWPPGEAYGYIHWRPSLYGPPPR